MFFCFRANDSLLDVPQTKARSAVSSRWPQYVRPLFVLKSSLNTSANADFYSRSLASGDGWLLDSIASSMPQKFWLCFIRRIGAGPNLIGAGMKRVLRQERCNRGYGRLAPAEPQVTVSLSSRPNYTRSHATRGRILTCCNRLQCHRYDASNNACFSTFVILQYRLQWGNHVLSRSPTRPLLQVYNVLAMEPIHFSLSASLLVILLLPMPASEAGSSYHVPFRCECIAIQTLCQTPYTL